MGILSVKKLFVALIVVMSVGATLLSGLTMLHLDDHTTSDCAVALSQNTTCVEINTHTASLSHLALFKNFSLATFNSASIIFLLSLLFFSLLIFNHSLRPKTLYLQKFKLPKPKFNFYQPFLSWLAQHENSPSLI